MDKKGTNDVNGDGSNLRTAHRQRILETRASLSLYGVKFEIKVEGWAIKF